MMEQNLYYILYTGGAFSFSGIWALRYCAETAFCIAFSFLFPPRLVRNFHMHPFGTTGRRKENENEKNPYIIVCMGGGAAGSSR